MTCLNLLPSGLEFELEPRALTPNEPMVSIWFITDSGKRLDKLAHGHGATWDAAFADLSDQANCLPDGSAKRAALKTLAFAKTKTHLFHKAILDMKRMDRDEQPGIYEVTDDTDITEDSHA